MKCQNCGNPKMRFTSKSKTPGWAIFLAILFFPIGLLFLLAKQEENYFVCDDCGFRFKSDN